MSVRPLLRSGLNIIARRKNELWYRRRLKLVADDMQQALVPELRRWLDTLSSSQNEISAHERTLVSREIALLLDQGRKRFRMPIDAKRTAEHAAQLNLASTDEWWTQQMRPVVEVRPSQLPQPRLEDAVPSARRRAATAPRTPRRRVRVRPTEGISPIATLNLIRGQAQIQAAFSTAVRSNVELIRSLPTQYYDSMEQLLYQNAAEAGRWEVLIDQVRETIGRVNNFSEYRSELIARDQSAKMAAAFNRARSEAVGVEEYTWSTAGDERVREVHRDNDGHDFRWDTGAPLDDGTLGHPGDDVNCRCAALPKVDASLFEEIA